MRWIASTLTAAIFFAATAWLMGVRPSFKIWMCAVAFKAGYTLVTEVIWPTKKDD